MPAPLLLALPYALQAFSALKQGENAKKVAAWEATQMESEANAEEASSQRAAIERLRQGQLMASRAQAVAAASGAGALDPTVMNLIAGIESEADYNARGELYEGKTAGNRLRTGAQVRREEGRQARRAGQIQALTSGIQAFGSMGGFGGGAPKVGGPATGSGIAETAPPSGYQQNSLFGKYG